VSLQATELVGDEFMFVPVAREREGERITDIAPRIIIRITTTQKIIFTVLID
jgi:hypothetical protein